MRRTLIIVGTLLLAILLVLGACAPPAAPSPPPAPTPAPALAPEPAPTPSPSPTPSPTIEPPKEPLSITIEPTSATMKVGETKEFTVTIKSRGWEDWEGSVREGWEGNVWDLHYLPVSPEPMYYMRFPVPLEEWMTEDEEGFPVMKPLILEKDGEVTFTLTLSFVEPSDDVWFRMDIRVRLSETEAITAKSNQVDITVKPA